jgi:flagellar basal body-associated protein FliL
MRIAAPLLAVALFAASAAPALASGGGSSTTQQAPATRQERLTSAETYLPMPTLSAGVLQRNRNQGTMVVDMGIDIPDEALRHRAVMNAPRIRDALRTALAN